MDIPNEAKKLDEILALCRWRFSNHYEDGQWEEFAKKIAGSDSTNPLFLAYIYELIEEKYIRPAEGGGYIATMKGQLYKGYSKAYEKKYLIDEMYEKKLRNDLKISEYQVKTRWLPLIIAIASLILAVISLLKSTKVI